VQQQQGLNEVLETHTRRMEGGARPERRRRVLEEATVGGTRAKDASAGSYQD
jgi:hypothetical protein